MGLTMTALQIKEFRNCFREIGEIESLPSSIATPYLQKYLVIRCCSLIETIFKELLFAKVNDGCSNETKNFLKKFTLDSSMNPSTKKIKALLEKFSGSWATTFETYYKTNTQYKNELDSLVDCRNNIAHGSSGSIPTFSSTRLYLISGVRILRKIESIIS